MLIVADIAVRRQAGVIMNYGTEADHWAKSRQTQDRELSLFTYSKSGKFAASGHAGTPSPSGYRWSDTCS
jgi:hypothetical protein